MKFAELIKQSGLADLEYETSFQNLDIENLSDDTRELNEKTIFCITKIAQPWLNQLEPESCALVLAEKSEEMIAWKTSHPRERMVFCKNIDRAQGWLSAALYGWPSNHLKIIGVTGTNGKTSITQMIYSAHKILGIRSAVIGTLGAKWNSRTGEKKCATGYTTPRAPELQRLLARMLNDGVEYVALEVSSQALDLGRLEGCKFNTAVFINLGQDHLDHHLNMHDYYRAKKKLFIQTAKQGGLLVINTMDRWGAKLAQKLQSSFGKSKIKCIDKIERYNLVVPVEFNYLNATLAINAMQPAPGQKDQYICALEATGQIPGRFELVFSSHDQSIDDPTPVIERARIFAIVDYAHTPDALENLLRAVAKLDVDQVICVFGCGGDRDQKKRPLMGNIAQKYADTLIVCDDNPRFESAAQIRSQILQGMGSIGKQVIEIADRKDAIIKAVLLAKAAGPGVRVAIVIAGKGHEDYQIIGSTKNYFSDVEEIQDALNNFI